METRMTEGPRHTVRPVGAAGKVDKDSLVVNVEDHAVGNANFLHTDGLWYTDSSHTTLATNDTAVIRALVTAGAKNLWFGSKSYRIQMTEGTAFLSWANARGVTVSGAGARLCDTTVYTVSPFNPYTPIFELNACMNARIVGVDYVGPAIASPLTNHGFVGATFVRAKNGCDGVVVDAQLTNCRYGVESGTYSDETEGYNRNFDIRIRGTMVGYPQAHYLAEGVRFDIDVTGVHRVSYLGGVIGAYGVARWADEYVADTCFLITDSKTGTGTSRGCRDLEIWSIDKGSTVFQPSTACAGIGLSRVDSGIVYDNIKIHVHTISTDTLSSTVGGFKLYSGAAPFTTPPASFNWEPTIYLRNITVDGTCDHSAQTIDGNTAGDIFVRTWDTSAAHAATVENLIIRDLVLKPSSGNTRGLYVEAPAAIGQGLQFTNVQAPGYDLTIYTPAAVPLALERSAFRSLIGITTVPRLVASNCAIGSTSGTITAVEAINTVFGATGGFFIRQKTASFTLSGAAVTWSSAIPAGCLPLGLSGVILTTVTGATGIRIGVGSDTQRYLNTNTLTAGFTFGPTNQAVTEQSLYWAGASALNINILPKTSNFTGGVLKLVFSYAEIIAPTS